MLRRIEILLHVRYGGQDDSSILYEQEETKSLCLVVTAVKIQVWKLALEVNFSRVYEPGSSVFLAISPEERCHSRPQMRDLV